MVHIQSMQGSVQLMCDLLTLSIFSGVVYLGLLVT